MINGQNGPYDAAFMEDGRMAVPDMSDPDQFSATGPAAPGWMIRPVLRLTRLIFLVVAGGLAACTTPPAPKTTARIVSPTPPSRISPTEQEAIRLNKLPSLPVPPGNHPPIDDSGRKETGKASFYARQFDGRKTSDGERFNPDTNMAASKTLPIGTTAKVVNLASGKAATVTVSDRGPFVAGRVLDVSPKTAAKLDMKHAGVAPVVVEPISVPQPDGAVKLGAGAAATSPRKVRAAVQTTKHMMARTRTETPSSQ
jgi:rare lipoprotein A